MPDTTPNSLFGEFQMDKPTRICAFADCGRRLFCRGLCASHWRQWSRGCELKAVRQIRHKDDVPIIRFKQAANGCLEFVGIIEKTGYGRIWVNKRMEGAHRFVWQLLRGDIPSAMFVDHICRNRRCINILHLRLVDARTNCLENSVSLSAINSIKKVCKRGHEFSEANTHITKLGHRMCRICHAMHSRSTWRRQKAVAT